MAYARVILIERGMRSLLVHDGVRRELVRRAQKVATRAREIAPHDSGAYADNIVVSSDLSPAGPKQRVRATVTADVSYSLLVEARYGTLGRALSAGTGP